MRKKFIASLVLLLWLAPVTTETSLTKLDLRQRKVNRLLSSHSRLLRSTLPSVLKKTNNCITASINAAKQRYR